MLQRLRLACAKLPLHIVTKRSRVVPTCTVKGAKLWIWASLFPLFSGVELDCYNYTIEVKMENFTSIVSTFATEYKKTPNHLKVRFLMQVEIWLLHFYWASYFRIWSIQEE
jgi:hypothetical protein